MRTTTHKTNKFFQITDFRECMSETSNKKRKRLRMLSPQATLHTCIVQERGHPSRGISQFSCMEDAGVSKQNKKTSFDRDFVYPPTIRVGLRLVLSLCGVLGDLIDYSLKLSCYAAKLFFLSFPPLFGGLGESGGSKCWVGRYVYAPLLTKADLVRVACASV